MFLRVAQRTTTTAGQAREGDVTSAYRVRFCVRPPAATQLCGDDFTNRARARHNRTEATMPTRARGPGRRHGESSRAAGIGPHAASRLAAASAACIGSVHAAPRRSPVTGDRHAHVQMVTGDRHAITDGRPDARHIPGGPAAVHRKQDRYCISNQSMEMSCRSFFFVLTGR